MEVDTKVAYTLLGLSATALSLCVALIAHIAFRAPRIRNLYAQKGHEFVQVLKIKRAGLDVSDSESEANRSKA